MVRQITCTTQPTLFLLVSFAPSQTVALKGQGEVSHRVEKKTLPLQTSHLYLDALMTFFLHRCSAKMLPKQQETHVCVMMALVKPLIVCTWVELEPGSKQADLQKVYGDQTIGPRGVSEEEKDAVYLSMQETRSILFNAVLKILSGSCNLLTL